MNDRQLDIEKGKYISYLIVEHKEVYDYAGKAPPAYRITCKEHKYLIEYLKQFSYFPENWQPSMIAEYYGVQIEVVMIVDAYL